MRDRGDISFEDDISVTNHVQCTQGRVGGEILRDMSPALQPKNSDWGPRLSVDSSIDSNEGKSCTILQTKVHGAIGAICFRDIHLRTYVTSMQQICSKIQKQPASEKQHFPKLA